MKDAVSVLFDTSALRAAGWSSAPLSTVLELSRANLLDVYLPQLVCEERRTQWRDAPDTPLGKSVESLRALAADQLVPAHHSEAISKALAAVEALDMEAISKDVIAAFIQENRLIELPMTLEQATQAWRGYFSGDLPYAGTKARKDIPDAHIFAAAQELLQKKGSVHFVCHDGGLASALGQLTGGVVHSSVEELLQSGILQEARTHWKRDQIWQKVQHNAPVSLIVDDVRDMLENHLWEQLHGFEFKDSALPGDWTVAHITEVWGGETIEISNPDDWGGGLMSFEVSCETDARIQFEIPREEEFSLMAWQEIGWRPERNMVDVSAKVRLFLEGTVDVEVDLENAQIGAEPLLSNVGFDDDSVKVYLIKY